MIRIYPTLVDSFIYYMNSEYMDKQEMIDRINRVERPKSDAMLKGSALNDLMDFIVAGGTPEQTTVKVRGVPTDMYVWRTEGEAGEFGRVYQFKKRVCDELLEHINPWGTSATADTQVYCKGIIETKHGPVEIYGYVDYLQRDRLIDLKTTSKYTFPKYNNGFQHLAYPFCMNQQGNDISCFQYLVTDTNHVYLETYHWNDQMAQQMLDPLNGLLDFISTFRDEITDPKVLGEAENIR